MEVTILCEDNDVENKVNSSFNYNRAIFEQQEIEGKDKSVIVNQLVVRNIVIDNLIKAQLPQTWTSIKEQPNERVLSFIASIVNTHISIFIMQVNNIACLLIIAEISLSLWVHLCDRNIVWSVKIPEIG